MRFKQIGAGGKPGRRTNSCGSIQDESAISVLHQWALRDAEAAPSGCNNFHREHCVTGANGNWQVITAVTIQH